MNKFGYDYKRGYIDGNTDGYKSGYEAGYFAGLRNSKQLQRLLEEGNEVDNKTNG